MSVTTAEPGRPAQVPGDAAAAAQARRARLRAAAAALDICHQYPFSRLLVSMHTARFREWRGGRRRVVVKWRPVIITGLMCAALAVIVLWVIHSRQVGYWLQVRTGTINESGPYYGFWSGFGSDIEEFGILGAIGAGIYQLVKKYNCHEPGCWRIGQHPAAGGQFLLCYRHHPDYQGIKPTHELIQRLHREHLERQAAIQDKLDDMRQHLQAKPSGEIRSASAVST